MISTETIFQQSAGWHFSLILYVHRDSRKAKYVLRKAKYGNKGKVKLRYNRITSQNCKSIKRVIFKIILELLKRSIV